MREVYRFIDSKDIREHLKNIRFEFSDRDIAYLIWQCDSISVKERHQAWRALIDAGDDRELSEHLRRVIAQEERELSWLTDREGEFRTCIAYLASGKSIARDGAWRTIDDCLCQFAEADAIDHLEVSKKLSGDLTVGALLRPSGEAYRIEAEGNEPDHNRLLHDWNSYAFPFPCPIMEGEYLKRLTREGVLARQSVRFLGRCYFDPGCGMLADCAWTDAFGEQRVSGMPLLDLERAAPHDHNL